MERPEHHLLKENLTNGLDGVVRSNLTKIANNGIKYFIFLTESNISFNHPKNVSFNLSILSFSMIQFYKGIHYLKIFLKYLFIKLIIFI